MGWKVVFMPRGVRIRRNAFYIGDGNEGGIGGGFILARLCLGQLWWVFD